MPSNVISLHALSTRAGNTGAVPWLAHPAIDLLKEASAGPDDRVLIIGASDAELLCAALRHGCRTALETIRPPPHPEPADVVIAPHVVSDMEADAVATCARRALGAGGVGGRLVFSLLGRSARAMARGIVRRLRDLGFERIRLRDLADGEMLVVCLITPPRLASASGER